MKIDETNIELVRHVQKVRDVMRKHGFTELMPGVFTKGDTKDGRMAVVNCKPYLRSTDDEIEAAAAQAAATYAKAIA